eukprot:scaffold121729_cov15-Prasinocladus_malaysianus.AAC.1
MALRWGHGHSTIKRNQSKITSVSALYAHKTEMSSIRAKSVTGCPHCWPSHSPYSSPRTFGLRGHLPQCPQQPVRGSQICSR